VYSNKTSGRETYCMGCMVDLGQNI